MPVTFWMFAPAHELVEADAPFERTRARLRGSLPSCGEVPRLSTQAAASAPDCVSDTNG